MLSNEVLPWKTVKLVNIVSKYDECKKMSLGELIREARFWNCAGKTKALESCRKRLTTRIIKAWLKWSHSQYIISERAGHKEIQADTTHSIYESYMEERNLTLKQFE